MGSVGQICLPGAAVDGSDGGGDTSEGVVEEDVPGLCLVALASLPPPPPAPPRDVGTPGTDSRINTRVTSNTSNASGTSSSGTRGSSTASGYPTLAALLALDWVEMYQFTYNLDGPWFARLAGLGTDTSTGTSTAGSDQRRVTFVAHDTEALRQWRASGSVPTSVRIVVPRVEPYGTHHTKMMIFFLRGGGARVVVHTANLIPGDWRYKTQGLWMSSELRPKARDPDWRFPGRNREFGDYLQRYLSAYGPALAGLVARLGDLDLTRERVALVGSVPGRHVGGGSAGARDAWGHARVASLLRREEVWRRRQQRLDGGASGSVPSAVSSTAPRPNSSKTLVLQCSSIGSGLSHRWLVGELAQSLSSGGNSGGVSIANTNNSNNGSYKKAVALVYPTVEQVRGSLEGWAAGGNLPFARAAWERNRGWLRPLLRRWEADGTGRGRAMPHIKTYCSISESDGRLDWLLLSSHNASQAAFGALQKSGAQLYVRSFELGVMFLPHLLKEYDDEDVELVAWWPGRPATSRSSSSRDSSTQPASQAPSAPPALITSNTARTDAVAAATRGSGHEEQQQEQQRRRRPKRIFRVPLAYDLPLRAYGPRDEPWHWGCTPAEGGGGGGGLDALGRTMAEALSR
ncbi:tyrosyl-DNA phosphodiesterase 1 [Cladochytrium tenue]|nr:tyrosyl-DNA phosphodiesterase 1 [Cladochytrium tenue]